MRREISRFSRKRQCDCGSEVYNLDSNELRLDLLRNLSRPNPFFALLHSAKSLSSFRYKIYHQLHVGQTPHPPPPPKRGLIDA